MTDQTIPADLTPEEVEAAREWATSYRNGFYKPGHADAAARALTALLPAPPRPTLADMDEEEQRDAVGMWADVDGFHPYRAVIGDTPAPKVPVFRPTAGALDWVHPEDVTPLPELGRAWSPGGSPAGTPAPAPALPEGWRLADHEVYGRVVVTTQTPSESGNVYFVFSDPRDAKGHYWHLCAPDRLTYLDDDQ